MALRFSDTYKSLRGNTLQIDIYDSAYTGTDVYSFNISNPTLIRERSNNLFGPIATTFSFTFIVENTDTQQFIDDLVGADETRFTIQIKRNGKPFFRGYVVPYAGYEEDKPLPQRYTIQAVCGIARMQGLEYLQSDGSRWQGRETIHTILFRCLTTASASGLWGSTDTFLAAVIDWWEDSRPADNYNTIFNYVTIDNRYLYNDKDGKSLSLYDVVSRICTAFACVLYQDGGRWRIEQLRSMQAEHTVKEFYIDATLKQFVSENTAITIDQTNNFRSQASFSLAQAASKCTVTYVPGGNLNLLHGLAWANTSATAASIGDIGSEINARLELQANIVYAMRFAGPSPIPFRCEWAVTVQVGSNYYVQDVIATQLTVTNSQPEWQSSAGTYNVSTQYLFPLQTNDLIEQVLPLNFVSQVIPSPAGNLTFDIQFVGAFDKNGNSLTASGDVIIETWAVSDAKLTLRDTAEPFELKEKVVYSVTNSVEASNELKLTTYLGDGPNAAHWGRMQVLDSATSSYIDTNQWNVFDNLGTALDSWALIGYLLAREYIRLFNTNKRVMRATIISRTQSLEDIFTLSYSGNTYKFFLREGSLRLDRDELTGEFLELDVVEGTLSDSEGDTPEPPPIGPVTGSFSDVPAGANAAVTAVATTQDTISAGTTLTQLVAENVIETNAVVAGNMLQVTNPATGQSFTATVANTPPAGSNIIEIESITVADDYPANSYISVAPAAIAQQANTGAGFTDLFLEDTTIDSYIFVEDVSLSTDANAGDGATAGLVIDASGIRLYDSVSTTPTAELEAATGAPKFNIIKLLDNSSGVSAEGDVVRQGDYIKVKTSSATEIVAYQSYVDTQVSNLESIHNTDIANLQAEINVAEDLFVQTMLIPPNTDLTEGTKWFDVVDNMLAGYKIKSFTAAVSAPSIDETWEVTVENLSSAASLTATISPLGTYSNVVSATGISLAAGNYIHIILNRTSSPGAPPKGLTVKIVYDKN